MTGRPAYETGALRRIGELGEKAIVAFFKDVSPSLRRMVASQLPTVSGFRPGTAPSVDRQIQALAHRIATTTLPKNVARSTEETALYGLWCGWGESHLGDPAVVRSLLEPAESAAADGSNGDALEPMRSAVEALATGGTTAREALDRFIVFSPFAAIDGLKTIAQQAPTAAQMERESAIRALPDRLHKDEELLQVVQGRLDGLEQSLRKVGPDTDTLSRALAEGRAASDKDRDAIAALAKTVEQVLERLSPQDEVLERILARLADAERRHDAADEKSAAAARDQAARAAAIDELRETVATLQRGVKEVDTRPFDDGIARLDAQIKDFAARLATVVGLAERLEQAETMLLELADRPPPTGAERAGASERVQRLAVDPGLTVKSLATPADMLVSLDAALSDAGLKKTAAAAFAEEVLAALAAEQVIFLRGSYAVDVGRVCALSLCGPEVHRLAIPVGLTDSAAIRQSLMQSKTQRTIPAVVIEGTNNAPLDVLRDVLLDQASRRIGSTGPSLVFACLVDGDGAFPVDASYLELGPVFDLEYMEWRRIKRDKLPILGAVSKDIWQAISSVWENKTVDYEEPLRGARRLMRRPNARVESNVVRAYAALTALRRAKGPPTPLQSVTFGWLSPYWTALGAKREAIDGEIDGGKCDGIAVDERLKAFLDAYGSDGGAA